MIHFVTIIALITALMANLKKNCIEDTTIET